MNMKARNSPLGPLILMIALTLDDVHYCNVFSADCGAGGERQRHRP